MTIAGTVQVHKSLPAWRRLARVGVVTSIAATAVLLTACGGGDQVKKFKPTKIVSFGDENSALVEVNVGGNGTVTTIKGFKYGVNDIGIAKVGADPSGLTVDSTQTAWIDFPAVGSAVSNTLAGSLTATSSYYQVVQDFNLTTLYTNSSSGTQPVTYTYTYYCASNRLWNQILANSYGLGYKTQCPSETYSGAVTYAENAATVTSTATQVSAHRGELDSNTLVTVMAGQNDVLNAYAEIRAGTLTLDSAKSRMTAQGAALAAIVNDVIKTGARVLVVKLPDLGVSPLGIADPALPDGSSAATNLAALVLAFNNGILNTITNDGTKIGLVNFYDYTRYIHDSPTNYGFTEMVSSVCQTTSVYKPDGTATSGARTAPLYGGDALLYCNSYTITNSASTYFWSDEVHLSPGAHAYLGSLAYSRADDNPF